MSSFLLGFGVAFKKEELEYEGVAEKLADKGSIACIDSGDRWVIVLKESVRDVGLVAGPIGISSMNASFLGYLEEFSHAVPQDTLGSSRPDWIMFAC
jgi:hypothetical protein